MYCNLNISNDANKMHVSHVSFKIRMVLWSTKVGQY